ncbi:MAG: murein L,D-transpeptidase family protein [Sphingobium sp.]
MTGKIPAMVALTMALAACVSGPPTPPPPRAPSVATPPAASAPRPVRVDFVLVDKSDRTLALYGEGLVLHTYGGLQFGDAPVGPKRFEGDERTPEGRYVLDYRNPQSSYHLSLHISYPNQQDRAFAAQYGRSPGGLIFIHGQPNGWPEGERVPGDWTDGCIALSNAQIEEIWTLVADGTPIEIRP